jgi:hypothetical protein
VTYRQYTQCVTPSSYVSMSQYIQATIASLIFGAVAAAMAIAAGEPWCALIAIEIAAMVWLIAFCDWWLYGRLICLDGDRHAAGLLVRIEPATGKKFPGNFDTDYSINLLPYPNVPGPLDPANPDKLNPDQATVAASTPFGDLVKNQDPIIALNLPFRGEFSREKSTGANVAVLHAEFEGAGMRDLQIGAFAGYGVSLAALFVCIAVPPPWGAIIAGILALLALLALLLGGLFGLGDTGSPTDVNPSLGSLQTDADKDHLGASLLYVEGTWVFDTMHEGWTEIHPIKVATEFGKWDGKWPDDTEAVIDRIRAGFLDARSDQTKDAQTRPSHRWRIHPDVDGCEDDEQPPIR